MPVGSPVGKTVDEVPPIIDIIVSDNVLLVEVEVEVDETELDRELELCDVDTKVDDSVVPKKVEVRDVGGGGWDVVIGVEVVVIPVGLGRKKVVVVNTVVMAFGAMVVVTKTVRGMTAVLSPEIKTVVVVSTVTIGATVG